MKIDEFLEHGGKITICPTINTTADREKIDQKRNFPQKEKAKREPIKKGTCDSCPDRNNPKKCLSCPKYKEFQRQYALREQILFDYMPNILIEEIADTVKPDIIQRLKELPFKYSFLLYATYFLRADQKELAEFYHCTQPAISKQIQIALKLIRKLDK